MSDVGVQGPENSIVYDLYRINGVVYCVNCWINHASCIHELIPRSKRPKDWHDIDNRVPLCAACHHNAHQVGTANSAPTIRMRRNLFITNFGLRVPFDTEDE